MFLFIYSMNYIDSNSKDFNKLEFYGYGILTYSFLFLSGYLSKSYVSLFLSFYISVIKNVSSSITHFLSLSLPSFVSPSLSLPFTLSFFLFLTLFLTLPRSSVYFSLFIYISLICLICLLLFISLSIFYLFSLCFFSPFSLFLYFHKTLKETGNLFERKRFENLRWKVVE